MARPVAAELRTQQAYKFLKEAAPLLSESGFGVLIPPWWNKGAAKTQMGIKLNVKPKREPKTGNRIFTFDSIINYNWQLALGGEAISEEEFEHLSSLKEPLVRIRGQWVELKKDEIDAAIKFFRSKNSGEMKLSEAMRLSIGQGESETGLPISGFEAKGTLSSLFEQLSGRIGIKQIQQPESFIGELRPYQVKGFSWLAFLRQYGLGACPAQFLGDGSSIPVRSGKLNRITEMLEEVLSEGDSALIFTQFAEMGGMLKAHFQKVFGKEVLFLYGGIFQKQRDQMVIRFSEKNGPRIFILSSATAHLKKG